MSERLMQAITAANQGWEANFMAGTVASASPVVCWGVVENTHGSKRIAGFCLAGNLATPDDEMANFVNHTFTAPV